MRYFSYLLLFSVCAACLLTAGCSQPGQSGAAEQSLKHTELQTPSPAVQQTPAPPNYIVAVTEQTRGKDIIITYQGGQDSGKLLYCTVFVNEAEQSKKLGNTPGDTVTLEGAATANAHVVVIGHFNDGSSQTVLETGKPGTTMDPLPYRVPTPNTDIK